MLRSARLESRLGRFVFLFIAFLAAGLATGAARPAPAWAGGNMMIIFDASGSMWGQLNGTAKIQIAKQVMADLIKGLPADMRVGLTVYGHRRKGDCNDVQMLVGLGRLDKKKLISLVAAIKPKGKTPMVRSIKAVAEKLKSLEDETTIVLISDGKETCDPDPCGFVKKLKHSGLKFVMHVVGFGVSGQADTELACLAKAGGGNYYPADSADKLKKSLTEVVKKVGSVNLVVSGFGPTGKPLSVWVRAFDGAGKEVDANGGKQAGLSLPPGTYNLTVKPETMTQVKELKDVKVVAGKVTRRRVTFAKARVKVVIKDESGQPIKGYARIVNLADGQYAEEGDVAGTKTVFQISPGKYLVDTECSNTGSRIKSQPFELGPGQEKLIETACVKSTIGVLVKDAAGKPIEAYIRIVDAAKDAYAEETGSALKMKYIQVPPGKYYVDIECPGTEKRIKGQPFELKPGQQVTREMTCR